ncbi:MAG: sugar phosphate isomerase/epimerase [Clostridiales Family XIII bacterium]|jgi:sugar phosphate isomerase/epimerase|nr:sugar phosphate isomerase/epimerase [Clostridiales Family XIII bacterium]
MKDSPHKYFRIGIVLFMKHPGMAKGLDPNTLEYVRRIAYDDYFDAIEINWIHDGKTRSEVARLLDQAHMTVCYGAQPRFLTTGLNPNDTDEDERQKAEASLFEAVDEAKEMGAKGVAFLAGKWKPETKELQYGQLLKTTRNLCDYAKTKDMFVELEVFDFDIDKASLIGPAPYAARFAADMRTTHNNFGLLIDLSHIPMTYETSEFVVRTLRPYITHFHVGNTVCADPAAEGYGDYHQRFGFPNSSVDTPEVLEYLRVLKTEGFFDATTRPVFSFELRPWQDEDPEAVIAGSKRVLNRAWAILEE